MGARVLVPVKVAAYGCCTPDVNCPPPPPSLCMDRLLYALCARAPSPEHSAFPSWLSHQVMPTAVEGDQRMSIAFNAPGYWPATMDVGASYGLSTNTGSDQEGGGAADVVYP
jgi:hypothetical protein